MIAKKKSPNQLAKMQAIRYARYIAKNDRTEYMRKHHQEHRRLLINRSTKWIMHNRIKHNRNALTHMQKRRLFSKKLPEKTSYARILGLPMSI